MRCLRCCLRCTNSGTKWHPYILTCFFTLNNNPHGPNLLCCTKSEKMHFNLLYSRPFHATFVDNVLVMLLSINITDYRMGFFSRLLLLFFPVRLINLLAVVVELLYKMASESGGGESFALEGQMKSARNRCFIHFHYVKEDLHILTEARFKKSVSSRSRWMNLKGNTEHEHICSSTYEIFADDSAARIIEARNFEDSGVTLNYHKTCYKRLCDEEKIRRSEENKRKRAASSLDEPTGSSCCSSRSTPSKSIRPSRRGAPSGSKRNVHVLPETCIICQRGNEWFLQNKVPICVLYLL